jgi:hypothetical protein
MTATTEQQERIDAQNSKSVVQLASRHTALQEGVYNLTITNATQEQQIVTLQNQRMQHTQQANSVARIMYYQTHQSRMQQQPIQYHHGLRGRGGHNE